MKVEFSKGQHPAHDLNLQVFLSAAERSKVVTVRNVFATEERAALEWTTEGTSNGEDVSYEGVSLLEIEDGKVRRFVAYFDTRDLTPQVVD